MTDNFFQVHLVSEHALCDDYVVRSFFLKNLQINETRTVTQFHFLTWPNNGIPNSIKTLLDFRRYDCCDLVSTELNDRSQFVVKSSVYWILVFWQTKNFEFEYSGVFRGAIGPWPPFDKKFFFHHRKKLGNMVWPSPFVWALVASENLDPHFWNPKYATVWIHVCNKCGTWLIFFIRWRCGCGGGI